MPSQITIRYKSATLKAFTLLETLLSIALISLILGATGVSYREFNYRNQLSNVSTQTRTALREAQIYARTGKGDDSWSVRLATGNITIYKGTDYTTRDTSYDVTFKTSTNVSFSGSNNVTFAKRTGASSFSGNITISGQGKSSTLSVSSDGYVN